MAYVRFPGLPLRRVEPPLPLLPLGEEEEDSENFEKKNFFESEAQLRTEVSNVFSIPMEILESEARFVVDGGVLARPNAFVNVLFRLRGGKGGFGALLKKMTGSLFFSQNFFFRLSCSLIIA